MSINKIKVKNQIYNLEAFSLTDGAKSKTFDEVVYTNGNQVIYDSKVFEDLKIVDGFEVNLFDDTEFDLSSKDLKLNKLTDVITGTEYLVLTSINSKSEKEILILDKNRNQVYDKITRSNDYRFRLLMANEILIFNDLSTYNLKTKETSNDLSFFYLANIIKTNNEYFIVAFNEDWLVPLYYKLDDFLNKSYNEITGSETFFETPIDIVNLPEEPDRFIIFHYEAGNSCNVSDNSFNGTKDTLNKYINFLDIKSFPYNMPAVKINRNIYIPCSLKNSDKTAILEYLIDYEDFNLIELPSSNLPTFISKSSNDSLLIVLDSQILEFKDNILSVIVSSDINLNSINELKITEKNQFLLTASSDETTSKFYTLKKSQKDFKDFIPEKDVILNKSITATTTIETEYSNETPFPYKTEITIPNISDYKKIEISPRFIHEGSLDSAKEYENNINILRKADCVGAEAKDSSLVIYFKNPIIEAAQISITLKKEN